MAFKDMQFPPAISFGAIGGPAFRTEVAAVESGHEVRTAAWSLELGRWEVGHNARLPARYVPLQAFFRIAQGRANSFRFKDWTDYEVAAGEGVFTALSATTFQCYKRYTFGALTYDRKIYLPVSTITVTGGTGVSVSYTTGVVSVSSGTPTAWTGEFDCLARFDIDQMQAETIDRNGSGGDLIIGWSSIPVVELRQP